MTIYTAAFTGIALAAACDIFELNAPSTGICVLHRCVIGQTTDYTDAADEGVNVVIERGATTSGSGGAAVTPAPIEFLGPAFTGTVERSNTTRASAGTIVQLYSEPWAVRDKWEYLPVPEHRIIVPPSGRLVVAMPSAPIDSLTCSGTMIFELIG